MNTLGGYAIEREIGRGGMGAVLRARAPDGRVVAIKVLLEVKDKSIERFDRERRLLAALGEAQGFVPLLDAGSSPRGPYLVMPFLEGGTLRDRLERGPLSIDEVVALGEALGTALGRAHAAGIVHRDLKPENILYANDGRPLVSDLGLAKHFAGDAPGASQSISLTKTGDVRGTASYMAPEQLNDAKSVGPPADVFALGAILYECLAGEPAFGGDSIHATFAAIAQCKPRPVRELRGDTPRWLAAVIAGALHPKADARPRDGSALARALEEGPPRRGAGPLVVAAMLAAAAIGGGAFLGLRPAAPPEAATPIPTPHVVSHDPPTRSRPDVPPGYRSLLETRTGTLGLVMGVPRAAGLDPNRDGKGGLVEALAVTRDGKRVLSGNHESSSLLLREVATGKELAQLVGHTHRVICCALSADGRRALSGSMDRTVRLWDLGSAKELRTFEGHSLTVRGVAFVRDEKLALSVGEDCALKVWDLATGSSPDSLNLHTQGILGLAVTPDGSQLITPSWDRTVGLTTPPGGRFDLDTMAVEMRRLDQVLRLYRGHEGAVFAAVLSPSGERVVSAGDDRVLRIWDRVTLADVKQVGRHDATIGALAMHPSGRFVASASLDRTIRLWDLKSGDELDRIDLAPATDFAKALAFTPDGRHLLAGTDRGLVLRFDLVRLAR